MQRFSSNIFPTQNNTKDRLENIDMNTILSFLREIKSYKKS